MAILYFSALSPSSVKILSAVGDGGKNVKGTWKRTGFSEVFALIGSA
jgi:hypothetical protein